MEILEMCVSPQIFSSMLILVSKHGSLIHCMHTLSFCAHVYIYTSANVMFMFWLKGTFWGTEIE